MAGVIFFCNGSTLHVPFEEGSVANAISYAKDILLKAIEEEQK